MNKGHYVCDVLYYNTGTQWNCDDETITQYSGYPINVYYDLSIGKKHKQNGEIVCMDGSYRIVSILYIKNKFLNWARTILLQGSQYQKRLNILRRA